MSGEARPVRAGKRKESNPPAHVRQCYPADGSGAVVGFMIYLWPQPPWVMVK